MRSSLYCQTALPFSPSMEFAHTNSYNAWTVGNWLYALSNELVLQRSHTELNIQKIQIFHFRVGLMRSSLYYQTALPFSSLMEYALLKSYKAWTFIVVYGLSKSNEVSSM